MCDKLINHDIEDESMCKMCDTEVTRLGGMCLVPKTFGTAISPSLLRRAGGSEEPPMYSLLFALLHYGQPNNIHVHSFVFFACAFI